MVAGTYAIVGLVAVHFGDWILVSTLGGASVLLVVPWWLQRRGRLQAGSAALVLSAMVSITVIATVGQGIRDLALMAFPIVFVFAGLALSRTLLRLSVGLAWVAASWLAFGEAVGWFAAQPFPHDPSNLFYWIGVTVLLLVAGGAVELLASNLKRNFELAQLEISQRRKVEETLLESRSLLLNAFGQNPLLMSISDLSTGQYLDVNDSFCKVSGFSREEALGKTAVELGWIREEDRTRLLNEQHHHGRVDGLELGLRNKSGNTVLCRYWGDVIQTAQGDRLFSTAEDITERRRAEEALRESEEKFSKAFETSPNVITIMRLRDRKYVEINDAFTVTTGYTRAEVLASTADDLGVLFDPEDRNQVVSAIREGRAVGNREMRFRKKNGQIFIGSYSAQPIQIGNEPCVISTVADITERKLAEESLRDNEARFRAFVEQAPVAIGVFDLPGFGWYANRAFLEMLRLPALEAMVGRPAFEFFSPRFQEQSRERTRRRLQGLPVPAEYESTFVRADGEEFPVHVAVAPIQLSDKTASIAFLTDITGRKRAEAEKAVLEAQLQRAEKLESVGRLAGGVAHDFNNMLAVILGHGELAIDHLEASHPAHRHLRQIAKAGEYSANLTNQLLAFARRQTIAPKVLDLNDRVASMLKMLQRLIGEDIDLGWNPDARLWAVEIDPTQVDQILTNLCVNARDAISGVGRLAIETRNTTLDQDFCALHEGCVPGEYVLLTVRDTGRGMDDETRSHVFEPFFTTKGVGQGTGLGLATVYGIVRQNNGGITVSSELGVGTTFTIYLPRYAGEVADVLAPAVVDAPQARGETVLLVEDEPAILELTTEMLARLGYAVLNAGSPEEALRLAREHAGEIHLLLTDVVMPQMNGQDLVTQLVALRPRVRRLFMSGYTADVIAERGVLEADVHFIQKPFTKYTLATKIRQVLDADPA